MRYASIRSFDISNGEGVGVSLFVQGCHFHCKNCFNKETWDFNGGKEFTEEIENKFFELIDRPYIQRVSILGGEPLANENINDVLKLVNKIRLLFPQKTIWLYSGYQVKEMFKSQYFVLEPSASNIALNASDREVVEASLKDKMRNEIIKQCDVLVDGRFVDYLKDLTLKFCGSTNQKVIDVKKSLKENKVVLYD